MSKYIFFVCLVFVSACAPRFEMPGAAIAPPALYTDHLRAGDGTKIAVRAFEAEDPQAIIVAAHGFNDYSNAFSLAGPWFAQRGISLVALDQRGFGETPTRGRWAGTPAMADDVAALVRAVHARAPDTPVYLLGVSMGGAVATVSAADNPLPIAGLILSGPAFWGWSQMNPLYRGTLWIAAHTVPWYTLTGEGLGLWPSDNVEMLRALSRDPLMIRQTRIDVLYGLVTLMDDAFAAAPRITTPTLVLFGDRDEIVPIAPVEAVVEKLGGTARLVRYEDGWHMLLRDLAREQVYADIAAWITDPEGELPSAAKVGQEVAPTPE